MADNELYVIYLVLYRIQLYSHSENTTSAHVPPQPSMEKHDSTICENITKHRRKT